MLEKKRAMIQAEIDLIASDLDRSGYPDLAEGVDRLGFEFSRGEIGAEKVTADLRVINARVAEDRAKVRESKKEKEPAEKEKEETEEEREAALKQLDLLAADLDRSGHRRMAEIVDDLAREYSRGSMRDSEVEAELDRVRHAISYGRFAKKEKPEEKEEEEKEKEARRLRIARMRIRLRAARRAREMRERGFRIRPLGLRGGRPESEVPDREARRERIQRLLMRSRREMRTGLGGGETGLSRIRRPDIRERMEARRRLAERLRERQRLSRETEPRRPLRSRLGERYPVSRFRPRRSW
jgi:hypothetical protein